MNMPPVEPPPLGDLATRMRLVVAAGTALWTLVAGATTAEPEPADAWPESRLLGAGLRPSDISLMPEGTPADYELFRPLRPTVVAWGEDALNVVAGGEAERARFAAKMDAYRTLGARHLATNVWMLTATERFMHRHPEYLDATCVDPWGGRILPRWLADADFQGVKPWWGCTNHPLFAEHLLARMKAGIQGGATMVHLDDHSGTAACAEHSGGCFCRYCVEGFRAWLAAHVPRAKLEAAGLDAAALPAFDYAAFLRQRGYRDRAGYLKAAGAGRVPLRAWFLSYQRDAAVSFIRRMQREAEQVAGHPVAFGVNAYNLLPTQLFDAHAIDYFANEVEHFDREDTIAPVVYRLGEALGRPVFATGTGEDWIAYRQARSTVRVHRWIAQAYAFGQYFMYSWRKWGFSEQTGTLWTEVPPEVFAPMTRFVSAHPELFDGFENAAATGLFYDNATAARNHWSVREASRALLDRGVPYGLVVSGDALLRKPLTRADLDHFRAVVIPPDVELGEAAKEVLAAWVKAGGRVLDEKTPDLPGRIDVQTDGRVWVLPRVRRAAGGNPNALVLHVLNRDYDAATDAMQSKRALVLTLDLAAIGGPAKVARASYYRPDTGPVKLHLEHRADGTTRVELPGLDVWGIVALE